MKMEARLEAAKIIVDFEARRDKEGHLMIYRLPPDDGGGRFEVAGINERYNRQECAHLVELIGEKKFDEAELYACEVIARDTDAAEKWHGDLGVRFYLRDCIFNRGLHGAARILQRAVKVKDDGIIGPKSRAAIDKFSATNLLKALRFAREDYERRVVGYRAKFWNGLENRWDKALAAAIKIDLAQI